MATKADPPAKLDLKFHLTNLPGNFNDSVPVLVEHIKKIIAEKEESHTCEGFYIGKTSVHQRMRKKHPLKFDPQDPKTWRVGEITRRLADENKSMGINTMVVLAIVTNNHNYPQLEHRKPAQWKQQYTLSLEQALISHFMFVEDDPRLLNNTTEPGNWERGGAIGYVLYLAMKLESKPSMPIKDSVTAEGETSPPAEEHSTPSRHAKSKLEIPTPIEGPDPSQTSDDVAVVKPKFPQDVARPKPRKARNNPAAVTPKLETLQATNDLKPRKPGDGTAAVKPATDTHNSIKDSNDSASKNEATPLAEGCTKNVEANGDLPQECASGKSKSRRLKSGSQPPSTPDDSSVKNCKCGSTEHRTTTHHKCPLRKPCKCGSTEHRTTTHHKCPLRKPCKCGSTEHRTTTHHKCPLRKPCKCGSTTHHKINHRSCPLNPTNCT